MSRPQNRVRRLAALALAAAVAVTVVYPASRAQGQAAKPAASSGNRVPRRALDRAMPAIKFEGTALVDVLDFLGDTSGANVSVDWKALDAAHVAKDTQITLRLGEHVPLRKVLSMVLRQASTDSPLTFYVEAGVIEVTSQEASDKVLISRTYPIQDLLFQPTDYTNAPRLDLQNASQGQTGGQGGGGGGGSGGSLFTGTSSGSTTPAGESQADRATEIVKLITDTVKPELWQVNGGTATISFFRGMLIVNAPRSIHELLESNF